MSSSLTSRARLLIGATTVIVFALTAVMVFSTSRALGALLGLLALLRFLLLVAQWRSTSGRARRNSASTAPPREEGNRQH